MRTLALLATALLIAGCSTDNDDRAFFETGWLRPEQGANQRLYGTRENVDADKPKAR